MSDRFIWESIDRVLRPFVQENKEKKYVIYTNGIGGKMVRDYLETEFHIYPEYIIDNLKYDGVNVLNLEQARMRKNENVYFLICSWHIDYYVDIREKIYREFSKEQIIDLFPNWIIEKVLPTKKEICDMLSYVDKYIKEMEKEVCS